MTTMAYDLDRELNEMADRVLHNDSNPHGQFMPEAEPASATKPATPATAARPQIRDAFTDEKNLAVLTHLGTAAAAVFSGGFLDVVVPAVAYVVFKDKGELLKSHVREQLNFQLTLLLVTIVGVVFSIVTLGLGMIVAVPVIFFFFIVDIVCSICAALAASRGEEYRFPLKIDFVK